MDDNYIVDLYLQRDESAIAHTRDLYGTRLCRLAEGILSDAEAARECENDTYLAAWNSIPPHEPRTYLYNYLARIVRHVALDYCRTRDRLKRKAIAERYGMSRSKVKSMLFRIRKNLKKYLEKEGYVI